MLGSLVSINKMEISISIQKLWYCCRTKACDPFW